MFLFQKKNIHPEPEQLSLLLPFQKLDQEDLFLLSKKSTLLKAKKGKKLFKKGSKDEWTYFLLSGELDLKDAQGVHKKLIAGTEDAYAAVSHLQPRVYTVTTLTDIIYIKMDKSLLDNIRPEKQGSHGDILRDANIKKATYQNNALYKQVHADLINNDLKFPNFQEISTKITKLLNTKDTDLETVSSIIQQDPVLTAKLMKAANGPLYYSQKALDSCRDAVIRIGVVPTKSISLGFLLNENLQFKLNNPELQKRVNNIRSHCSEVAVISYVIARLFKRFSPEQAMLAGLVHDIGAFPILYYAEQHPELINGLDNIDEAIRQLSGELGALLLEKWNFPDEIITVAREADIWQRDNSVKPDYCDIVLVAQAYSFIGKKEAKLMPKLQQIPALKKLKLDKLTPQNSIKLLDEAKSEIIKAKALFK